MQNTGACADWIDGHEWRALRDQRFTYAIYRRDGKELLFDNLADPYQMKNLAEDPVFQSSMEKFRSLLKTKMKSINDTFECCTWYRDHWTENRIVVRTATLE
jgi:arylsulfatase A-like enzyme